MVRRLLWLLLVLPSVVFADELNFKDNATVNVSLSRTDINRIAIFEDKILSINGPTGLYSAKNDVSGAAYITLLGASPFMLFIATVKGHSVSLFVRPQKVIGKTLVLMPTTPLKTSVHKEGAASYQKNLVTLINGMASEEAPEEFIYSKPLKPEDKDFFGIANLTPIAVYTGAELLGTVYKITNTTQKPITLSAAAFYKPGVRAVALSTQTLEPKASGLVYEVTSR